MDTTEQEFEEKIAQAVVNKLLASGYSVGINDGEVITVKRSTDTKEIFAAMRTTDEDYVLAYDGDGKNKGWVRLVYGNGEDVLTDYTTNLEKEMSEVMDELFPEENIHAAASSQKFGMS